MNDRLKALVTAAVELAIVRHNLVTHDLSTISEADVRKIAEDVWEALNGNRGCGGKIAPELVALLATRGYFARRLRIDPIV